VNSGQTGHVVARLEALLARIRSRAAEPRPRRAAAAAAASHAAPAPAAAAKPAEPEKLPTPSDHPSIVDHDELGEWPTRPPPAPLADAVDEAARLPAAAGSAPRAEETPAEKAYESRERLVAASSVAAEETAHSRAAVEVGAASAPEVEAVIEEDSSIDAEVAEAEAIEDAAIEEEAPASSRRTLAQQPEERIAEIAFGADEPPREPLHTPPPESGRLPAAAAAIDFDGDVTGVRDSAPVAPLRPQAAEAAVHQSSAPTRELVPEPTHPNLPAGDGVAEVIGEAQRFSPGTFVALLDASLAL
jgi:hypothetical protein